MANYQQLSKYSGSLYGRPQYDGIEYDWEVPDNLIVGSPGGVSTIHHHYTKGFDGRGNTSSDVYAGQGQRYNAGVYGNMYQIGQEAGQNMGYYPAAPDYQFWQNQEPSQFSYTHSEAATWVPNMRIYGQPGAYQGAPGVQKKVPITEPHPMAVERYVSGGLYGFPQPPAHGYEGYSNGGGPPGGYEDDYDDDGSFGPSVEMFEGEDDGGGDFELLQPADVPPPPIQKQLQQIDDQLDTIEDNQKSMAQKAKDVFLIPTIAPWMLFLFFLLAFIAFDFWAEAGHLFIRQRLHGGATPTWKQALFYAIVITAIFALAIWLAGVPVTTFETL